MIVVKVKPFRGHASCDDKHIKMVEDRLLPYFSKIVVVFWQNKTGTEPNGFISGQGILTVNQ